MDWQKAKTYTIIILTVLNIFLLIFNIAKDREYRIDTQAKQAVTGVLEKEGINIQSDIPTYFEPMRQLSIKQPSYDYFELEKMFFDSTDNLKKTSEFGKSIFMNDDETMTIQGSSVYYENRKTDEKYTQSKSNAIKKCIPYVERIGKEYARFSLERTKEYDNYYVVEFMQKFNDYVIFNNYALFYVFDNGAVAVEFMYNEPIENTGSKVNICSADEALFAFYKEVKKLYDDEQINIIQTSLGYYRTDDESGTDTTCVPYYRIVADGFEKPCFVNAYTQEVIVY